MVMGSGVPTMMTILIWRRVLKPKPKLTTMKPLMTTKPMDLTRTSEMLEVMTQYLLGLALRTMKMQSHRRHCHGNQ
jgi:hypothetical protein